MAQKGIPGSGSADYWIKQQRKDSMASKYVGASKSQKPSKGHGKSGGKGC